MSNCFKKALLAGMVVAATSMVSTNLLAEETSNSGPAGTSISTDARLDFTIIIPEFLRFRVGDTLGTIDEIEFDASAVVPGAGGAGVAGTGGDVGLGVVTASVLSNSGAVTIEENNNSGGLGLANAGATLFVPYTEITTTSSDPANFPAPALSNAGTTTSVVAVSAGEITNRSETWTYNFSNSAVYAADTYGTSAFGGRVTYTASTP